jgi:predicted transcriptional regulator
MSSPKTCMTLRLDPAIEELVTEAAHDKGVTKTAWIRSAIRQRLKAQRELQDSRTQAAHQG